MGGLSAHKFCSLQWSRTCFKTRKASLTRLAELNLFQQPHSCACWLSLVLALSGSIFSLLVVILGADTWSTASISPTIISQALLYFLRGVAVDRTTCSHTSLKRLPVAKVRLARWIACRSLWNGIVFVVTLMGKMSCSPETWSNANASPRREKFATTALPWPRS